MGAWAWCAIDHRDRPARCGVRIAVAMGRNNDPRLSRAFIVIGADVLTPRWTLLPLLAFGTDETLDPSRLQLLPLEPRPR